MASVIEESKIDDIVKLYQSGLSINDVAMRAGVNRKTADKYIGQRGIPKRTMAEAHKLSGVKLALCDKSHLKRALPDEAIALYQSGVGVKEIGSRFGACYKRISRQLREAGIFIDRSMTVERRFGPDAQRQWAAKASAAVTLSADDLHKRAVTRQGNLCLMGVMEAEFSQELMAHGLEVTQQLAVGSYNIDIALDKHHIAIEIQRGAWQGATSAKAKRIEYLLNRGWRIVYVQISRHGAATDIRAITDKLVSLTQVASGNPAVNGQYGVLSRNGKPTARLPEYFNRWTRIPGF